MFKSAISSLTSAVVGATKETIKQYLPHVENDGDSMRKVAINTIIQGGIARIANRSPILYDIAQNTFKIHQAESVKRQKVSAYVKSSRADWLRPKVKESLDPAASDKKINEEMVIVISKISKEIDRVGVEETRNSGKFKEYEKYFDEFMSKQDAATPQGTPTSREHSLGDEILHRIESNTRQTVNALESLSMAGGIGASPSRGTVPSFIDPLTGMPSIKAGIGSIGGSMLSKIFDDDMMEKFAKKAKSFFNVFDDEPAPTPTAAPEAKKTKPQSTRKKRGIAGSIETMFAKDMFDLDAGARANYVPEIKSGLDDNTSESAKEVIKERADIARKQQDTSEQILEELKHLNKTTEKHGDKKEGEKTTEGKPSSGIVNSILSKGKDLLMNRLGGGLLGKVLPRGAASLGARVMSGQGARVAGKIAGRVMRGGVPTALKAVASRVVGAAPVLAAGGDLVSGATRVAAGAAVRGLGVAALGGVSAPVLGAAAITAGASALGYGAYKAYQYLTRPKNNVDKNNPSHTLTSKVKETSSMNQVSNHVSANTTPKTSELNKLTDVKKHRDAEKTQSNSQPIVINNNNGGSGGGSGGVTAVNTASVRNRESTFERVQMQDFWPRVA